MLLNGKGNLAAGIILLLAAIAIPSPVWIALLRTTPPSGELAELLNKGAIFFRVGVAALGIFIAALPYLADWSTPRKRLPDQSYYGIGIGIIVVAAFLMRLIRLGEGLWLDEILTFVNYAHLSYRDIFSTYASENQHFLYSFFAHACFQIFGPTAWALRLPAAIFGAASIWALYLLGRDLIGPRDGFFAAALLAFSYHHVWFSQNARGYTALLFWAILSSWFLVRAIDENRPSLWIWYGIAVAFGIFSHTTMAFVALGQFLAYCAALLRRRNEAWPYRFSGLFVGFVGGALFSFLLHALTIPQMRSSMGKTVSVVEAWKKPGWTLLEVLRGLQINFAGGVVVVIALAVFAVGLWSYWRTRPILVELLILPPALGAAVVLSVGHHLWPRFFFFAFGFGALVVIRGVLQLEHVASFVGLKQDLAHKAATAAAAGMIIVSAASVPFAFGPKQDYLGALEFAKAQQKPGDVIVSTGLASFPYTALYKAGFESAETLDQLNAIRGRAQRTILLYTLEPVLAAMEPDVLQVIKSEFTVAKQFRGTLQGGTVYVCIYPKTAQAGI